MKWTFLIGTLFCGLVAFSLDWVKPFEGTPSKIANAEFDRVQILYVRMKSFPKRKRDGEKWDNASAFFKPDVYVQIQDIQKGALLFNNPSDRRENVELNEEVTFPINLVIKNLQGMHRVAFLDFDSFSSHDEVAKVSFIPSHYLGQSNVLLGRENEKIELGLEWLSSD
ncbi:MAG: hypothetical protein GYB31_04200 [Bacteroidetes bacterium]|nr:hypothetical protein [Bacteroidota bacterium]